jgi:integrase
MPKPKRRSKKGSVAIGTRNGMLRLRWTHQGEPHDLSLHLQNTPLNLQAARIKASEIERDMALGAFDSTLVKYKPSKVLDPIAPPSTLELWERFIEYRRHDSNPPSPQAIASRYRPIAANLRRFSKDITSDFEALEFVTLLRTRQSARIANQNLSLLKGFGTWTVEQGHRDTNPFTSIVPVKASKPKPDRPFGIEEIRLMIAATTQDPVLLKYRDFVLFLLNSGCRPSEAIGLRWEHVDFSHNEIHICESLSRGAHGQRIRKSTKTENGDRILNMPPNIRTMLEGRAKGLERISFHLTYWQTDRRS